MATLSLPLDAADARAVASARRLAGAAALGYVISAGVENMEVLGAPSRGAAATDIRAAYSDQALAAVTFTAGALSLLFYAALVVALLAWLPRGAPGRRMVLLGGVLGPVLAAAGLAATAPLAFGAPADDLTRWVFDLQVTLRIAAGPFMALLLLGTAIAARRSAALPAPLRWSACAAAVPLFVTPLTAFAHDHAAMIAFGLHGLWIWLAALWLVAGGAGFVRRAAFLMLVLAAGLIGVALLIVPDATGAFFAWELEPEPLAAFAGGVYVGSAVIYAAGLRAPWQSARPLVAAAVVLSISVSVISAAHLDVFDFGRLQAWAWMVLFAGFALVMAMLLATGDRTRAGSDLLAARIRVLLAVTAAALTGVGIALWIDPGALPSPFALPLLGGRFAGSWTALLGVLAGWAAVYGRPDEARLPGLALVALPAGALVAALRTGVTAPAYLAALLAVMAIGCAVLGAVRRSSVSTSAHGDPDGNGWAVQRMTARG